MLANHVSYRPSRSAGAKLLGELAVTTCSGTQGIEHSSSTGQLYSEQGIEDDAGESLHSRRTTGWQRVEHLSTEERANLNASTGGAKVFRHDNLTSSGEHSVTSS